METNKLLGMVLMFCGVADIMIARLMGDRLPAKARTVLSVSGAAFIGVGSLLSLGFLKLV